MSAGCNSYPGGMSYDSRPGVMSYDSRPSVMSYDSHLSGMSDSRPGGMSEATRRKGDVCASKREGATWQFLGRIPQL